MAIFEQIPEYLSLFNVIKYIKENRELYKCENCGKYLTATQCQSVEKRNSFKFCSVCNKLPEIRKKVRVDRLWKNKQTNIKKYGCEYPAQNKTVLEKNKQTNLEKYGCEFAIASSSVKTKIKETLKKRYGVDNPGKKFTWKIIGSYKQFIVPLFSKEEFDGYNKNYRWKCVKCGHEFEQHIYKTFHNHDFPYLPRCLKCYPFIHGFSKVEKELVDFCKQFYPDLKENDRELIKPYELDIVIPELKLAIELNGDYWHCHKFKPSEYHLNKTIACEQIGYRLIHIFEHEWLNNREIIQQKLEYFLNPDKQKIFARKCVIKNISVKDKNEFLNKNHIQGEDKSRVKLGLFYENELVAVMTFGKPRFNKKYQWELIRYATSKHVIGGAGKLLKYFERKFKPESIITYADRRFSQGNMYRQLNFTLDHISTPNFCWINKSYQIKSRLETQKHKITSKEIQKLTADQIMIKSGFNKIYDCGNLVFTKEYQGTP